MWGEGRQTPRDPISKDPSSPPFLPFLPSFFFFPPLNQQYITNAGCSFSATLPTGVPVLPLKQPMRLIHLHFYFSGGGTCGSERCGNLAAAPSLWDRGGCPDSPVPPCTCPLYFGRTQESTPFCGQLAVFHTRWAQLERVCGKPWDLAEAPTGILRTHRFARGGKSGPTVCHAGASRL